MKEIGTEVGLTRERVRQIEIEALKKLWYDVQKEDHAMVERMQEGKASDVAAGGGMLSPHWEISVRRFQELALEAVTRHSRGSGNP